MSDFDVKEKRFEEDIEDYLTHHGGYTKGDPKKFNRESGLEEDTFVEFIKTSQPKKWERYVKIYAENSEKQIIERFKREVKTTNLLNVMRHGFMDRGIKFYPIFWKPETSLNETTQMQYDANILHCTRQLHYSVHNENSIDIVLFANGIPVVSMELKCQFTGQDTTNAINQYKFDRAGKDAIFAFKERVLVHFAVDLTNVYMTTRLEGAHTYFLPFNQGSNGAGKVGGKGNPVNPNGYDTAYLWERVLCKDSLMEILQKYMHLQQEYDKNGNLVKETMIFPRYHQLDVVTKLLEDVKKNGSGKSYLIQHSAGSGKSNSIAWLAHRLTGLHDYEDNKIFQSVIIVTDRRVLDSQLQSTVYQFDHVEGVVKKVDKNSGQLRDAINDGVGIIISGHDTRVLLLSATPYKLYSTLEEIDENQLDEHYAEFFQVMNFLFDDEVKDIKFKEVWKNYSHALSELKAGDSAIIRMKELAENAMYQGVSRTERISVMDSGDYTDDSSVKHHLQIDENDINSYIQMSRLLSKTDSNHSLPVDYAKSCPYLMSFMKKYKIKEQIEKYYIKHPDEFGSEREQCLLWLNRNKINKYDELPKTNARLEALKEKAFTGGAEKYLWIPPSLPYYEMQGAYKNSKGFSKILVFSAWEMVPRMIGALVSYEAERLTVGKLVHQIKNQDKKNTGYFADGSRRYPVARLRFNVSNGEVRGMSLFALLYPSKTLSDMYLPIESLNNHESLEVIEKSVRLKLKEKLAIIEEKYGDSGNNKEDARWYYLAPMLMDGVIYAKHWIEDIVWEMNTDEEDTTSEVRSSSKDKRNKGFIAHIDKLRSYLDAPEEIHLGRKPEDLLETLVNMVLGSPAICIYRSNGRSTARATSLAKVFVNNFNLPESTAIIDLAYGRCRDDNSHWQNVLKYCKDGCFQAMIDEYIHMLKETAGFQSDGNQYQIVHDMMMDSLKIHTATYIADTYPDFKKRINGADRKSDGCRIRSSYAVGFTKDAGDNSKVVMRKENIRNAFNSPMRPFVLATTSIGQEGLDFHNYCRVIMHWNLPSNPIDVGRILRTFKIKKNVEVTDNGKIII